MKKLSKPYYLKFSGSCGRVYMLGKYKMDEYPYDTRKAIKCTREGKHPHKASALYIKECSLWDPKPIVKMKNKR